MWACGAQSGIMVGKNIHKRNFSLSESTSMLLEAQLFTGSLGE